MELLCNAILTLLILSVYVSHKVSWVVYNQRIVPTQSLVVKSAALKLSNIMTTVSLTPI